MALSLNLNYVTTNLPAQTKTFCLNAKPFTEIFIVPKQTAMIHELTTYFFGNTASKSLNLEENEKCEGMLNKAECLQARKSMKPGKTPGSDGLLEWNLGLPFKRN